MEPAWERAVTHGDVEGVHELLSAGARVDARNRHGQTAVMIAARRGHRAIVEALIAHGADLNVTAKYGLSALMLAVVAGHTDVARCLARAGADLTLQGRGAPGFADQTAYDLAIARGMDDAALLRGGPDRDAKS